jgi:hypothetical protein
MSGGGSRVGSSNRLWALLVALMIVSLAASATVATPGATVVISGTQWGTSTCYIGATEGNVRFDPKEILGAGMNTYRIYGGMSRWEQEDDDGVYGSPSIAEIQADANVINWAWWDNVMTSPPNGSDYWWSGEPGTTWPGNARTLFEGLKANSIRPVLTIRNVDNNDNPDWAPNPPRTEADWNEWWEHVFATVYWLNVRNDYRVDDFEVHNEPNNRLQGWDGTQADYFQLVRHTKDAIDFVYRTYLPERGYHVYAPVAGGDWVQAGLNQVADSFDSVDVHNYQGDISSATQQYHAWMEESGHGGYPLWISEWATYRGGYDRASTGVKVLVNNLIRGSRPDNDYIYGSHMFTFYDWDGFHGGFQNFEGLVDRDGNKRSSYYAMRLANRALVGCRPTYQATVSDTRLLAIATTDGSGAVYVLVTNSDVKRPVTVDLDLSALRTSGTGTQWQYDAQHPDVVVGEPSLTNGHITFTIPGTSAMLFKFP